MSKTERALESEALDRDDLLADGHHDVAGSDDVDDLDIDEVAVFDAEAGERDWPIAPTDEVRRPTLDAEDTATVEDDVAEVPDSAIDAEADVSPDAEQVDDTDAEVDDAEAGVATATEPATDVDAEVEVEAGTDESVVEVEAGPTAEQEPDGTGSVTVADVDVDDEPAMQVDASDAVDLPEPSSAWDPPLEVAAADTATETDTGSNGHRPPEDDDEVQGFVGPEPSEDVLEELRRADVDGPTVIMAPQDDTTSARRRPRRLPEYDPAPIPVPTKIPRVLGRKPRVRKVTRVVRSVDPWSVFKIAMIASLVLYVIMLTAGVLLWNVAYATGTIDNVERFFESFGWSSFEFNGGEIFHAAWIGGLFAAIGLTGLAVLGAALFNLITDLVGGVRLTVLEEEVVETRISPMRRFVVRRSAPEVPAVEMDESGPLIRETIVDDSGAIIRRTR